MGKYIPPTPAEIHSFGIGAMNGVAHKGMSFDKSLDIAQDNFDDVKKEKHYYRLGYFLTNRGKWIIGTLVSAKALIPGVI